MKRFIVAVLLTLLVCTSAFAMKNEPDGFRGIKWGDKLSQHLDLKLYDNTGPFPSYCRPNERLQTQFGNISKDSEALYFFDEKEGFFVALIEIEGDTDVDQLHLKCSELWGKAIEIERNDGDGAIIYIKWGGQQTSAELKVSACLSCKEQKIDIMIRNKERWQRAIARSEKNKPNS